jgi:hypothetical protein
VVSGLWHLAAMSNILQKNDSSETMVLTNSTTTSQVRRPEFDHSLLQVLHFLLAANTVMLNSITKVQRHFITLTEHIGKGIQ